MMGNFFLIWGIFLYVYSPQQLPNVRTDLVMNQHDVGEFLFDACVLPKPPRSVCETIDIYGIIPSSEYIDNLQIRLMIYIQNDNSFIHS